MLEPHVHSDDSLSPGTLPRSGIPLYIQVAGLLRRRLESGAWRLGECIPPIETLMAEYRVSRVTMRQALAGLEREKLVRRVQGKGTVVTRDSTQDRWLILPTDSTPPPPEAGVDGLAPEYWHTKRVTLTDATPYSLTSVFVDRVLYERDAQAYDRGPILPLLAKRLRRSMGRAVQRLKVSTADVETAHHLQIPVGAPVVEVMRIVWNASGRMVYVADVRYHARHLRIETTLYPAPQPSTDTSSP